MGVTAFHTGFVDCDIVVVRPDRPVRNVVAFQEVELIRGEVVNCTIFVAPDMIDKLLDMPGAFSISLTGDPKFDNQSPQSTAT
jgi:hypothetical protein